MNLNPLNEQELTEILKIAEDGEKKLKQMSNYATMMAEKWRIKNHPVENNNKKNETIQSLKTLYNIENYQWLEITIKLLKEKRLEELDIYNLIEELELLGRRDKLAVESLLEEVIRHLLLLNYWQSESENNSNHWQAEIMSFRTQLQDYLTTNLQNHLSNNLLKIYQKALKYVNQKTGFSVDFPEECPYSFEQLLDFNWLL